MRRYWKATYVLPMAMAGGIMGMPAYSAAQEGVPAQAEVEAQVEAEANPDAQPEAPIQAELDGEAPSPEPESATPEVEQPTVEGEAEAAADTPAADASAEAQIDAPPTNAEGTRDAPVDRERRGRGESRREAGLETDRPNVERPRDRDIRDRDLRQRDRRTGPAIDVNRRLSRDLGFQYEVLPDRGFRVTDLIDDSIWARSGFRTGDQVLRVGDQRIARWDDFRGVMGNYYGERVPVYVIREGREMPVYVDLTDYERPFYLDPDYDPNQAQRAGFGIGLNKIDNAVVVSRVYPGSPAALAGMRVGDIIVAANGREIDDVDDVVGYIRSLTPGDDLVLQVRRAGENMRIASRLSTWASALDTAPPEELFADRQPEELYFDHDTRINALEERIRDLEAAVRGLRREMTDYQPTTEVQPTDLQQRDVQLQTTPPRD